MDNAYPLKMMHFIPFYSEVVSLVWILRWASCKEIRIPKSVKFALVQCKMQQICTWNPEYGSRNPESDYLINDWDPESKVHWQRIQNPVPGIRNPRRGNQNPRLSWFPLHRAIKSTSLMTGFILLHKKCLQFDWLRAVIFQLNLKYPHVKITILLRVVDNMHR